MSSPKRSILTWLLCGAGVLLCIGLAVVTFPLKAAVAACGCGGAGCGCGQPDAYVTYMRNFLPQNVSTAHWTESRTTYRRVNGQLRSSADAIEGWYRAAGSAFRHDYPANWAVSIGNVSWVYWKRDKSYSSERANPTFELEQFFRPDNCVCTAFYTAKDLSGSRDFDGEYHGARCHVLELDYRAKGNIGPKQILVYYDPSTRLQIARVAQEWDAATNEIRHIEVREFQFNIGLSDSLFTFTPPAGSHPR